LVFSLLAYPLLKLVYGFPLDWQFHVGIGGMHSRSARMAHQRHSDILNYSCLHEARVEGVPQIMKPEVP
jgi:hypothetical protein